MININQIEIEGYRGILRVCSLHLEGKSLLLFGENGTGKSSFIDAIERLFTGKVSTLEGRMGVSTDRHGPNIRISGLPKISVLFSDETEVTLKSTTTPLPHKIKKYLIAAGEPIYILRRRQILNFIESKPHERYAILRPFLPLAEAEETEEALRLTFRKTNDEKSEIAQKLKFVTQELAQAVGIDEYKVPLDEQKICKALSLQLKEVRIKIQKLSNLDDAVLALDERLEDFGDAERLMTLHGVLSLLEELKLSLNALNLTFFDTAVNALKEKEKIVGKTFFEDVLNHSLEWIQTDWQGVCPLCETRWEKKPHDRDALVEKIEARLYEMREVVKSRKDTNQVRIDLIDSLRKVQDYSFTLKPKLENLIGKEDLKLLDELVESLQNLRKLLEKRLDQVSPDKLDVAIKTWNTASYSLRVQELISSIKSEAEQLPSPEKIKSLIDSRSLLDRIKKLWQQQTTALFLCKKASLRTRLVSVMLRFAEEARREEVQELFDSLSKDINTLYLQLNPGENHGDIQLKVRPEVRGSASIRGRFFELTNEDPLAYYSDAHLDTLGLCTFLALRRWYRKQHPDFNLLILDDVLTSVDTQHAVRTSELILKEFKDYQIFLTTHDRIWYEYLRDIQARCRVKGQFLNKVIHKWTIEEGPDLREPEEERERLEKLLATNGASQIAVEAGRLLEHILQEMRYSLRLSVQAKRGEQYEIGGIWPAFYSMLRKRYQGFYEKCGGILDTLDIRWTLRNWVGAHFNQWASRVSKKEVIEFGQTVCKLFDCLFCKDCRRFVEPSMTPAGQLSCRCGNLIYSVPGKKPLRPLQRGEIIRMTKGTFSDAQLNTKLYLEWKRAEKEKGNT